jgi:hypothetical protein
LNDPPRPSSLEVALQPAAGNKNRGPITFYDRPHPSNFEVAEKAADELFERGEFVAAVQAYQKIIESGYKIDFDI